MIESLLYRLGIGAYSLGVKAASGFNPKAAKLIAGHKETWRLLESEEFSGDWIWVHAASLGEFEQGRPIIERIKSRLPGKKIILTFFSPSGYEVRKNYPGADVICYLPFDSPGNARRFIRKVRPEMAIFVKYEIWRNYLHELHRYGIPAYLISAAFRPGQAFFKLYGKTYRRWLRLFRKIFVQDEGSGRLLEGIGIKDVEVAGDTRFDRVTDVMKEKRELYEIERFAAKAASEGAPVMVAGSSWGPDEDVYIPWLNDNPEVRAIIAPHEFDDQRLKELERRLGPDKCFRFSQMSEREHSGPSLRYIIVDCFGLLSSIYRFGDFAHIGGGYGVGIHNINEAAVYGIPVTFGPNYHRFIEAEELIEAGGAVSCSSEDDFRQIADIFMQNPDERQRRGRLAAEYIRSKLGASDRVFNAIFKK